MTVGAIDIGYGTVKYTRGKRGLAIACGHIPAVAPVYRGIDYGGKVLVQKEVLQVRVGNADYIVGPDAPLSLKQDRGRILTADYTERDVYLALLRGALGYMKQSHYALLVTGLPVSLYQQHRDKLAARLEGDHPYPNGDTVTIERAWVIPQPVGGFLYYATEFGSYSTLREANCLVIDVGFYTVDWLVCRGLKVIEERSGSIAGGLSKLLEALALELSHALGESFEDINRLDTALNADQKLDWYGTPIDFKHLLPKVEPIIESALATMASSVGTLSDIVKVIVVGGGAKRYLPVIRKLCRPHAIAEVNESIYANVRGYFIAGEKRIADHGR